MEAPPYIGVHRFRVFACFGLWVLSVVAVAVPNWFSSKYEILEINVGLWKYCGNTSECDDIPVPADQDAIFDGLRGCAVATMVLLGILWLSILGMDKGCMDVNKRSAVASFIAVILSAATIGLALNSTSNEESLVYDLDPALCLILFFVLCPLCLFMTLIHYTYDETRIKFARKKKEEESRSAQRQTADADSRGDVNSDTNRNRPDADRSKRQTLALNQRSSKHGNSADNKRNAVHPVVISYQQQRELLLDPRQTSNENPRLSPRGRPHGRLAPVQGSGGGSSATDRKSDSAYNATGSTYSSATTESSSPTIQTLTARDALYNFTYDSRHTDQGRTGQGQSQGQGQAPGLALPILRMPTYTLPPINSGRTDSSKPRGPPPSYDAVMKDKRSEFRALPPPPEVAVAVIPELASQDSESDYDVVSSSSSSSSLSSAMSSSYTPPPGRTTAKY